MSDYCLIPLNGGKRGYALVSPEDYAALSQYNWTLDKGYAIRMVNVTDENGLRKRVKVQMHNEVLRAGAGKEVDHRNHNRVDNRRENLRLATRSQNVANTRPRAGKYKGVAWNKRDCRWHAQIGVNGARLWLGRHTCPKAAARAYDLAALEAWPEHAYLNFPELRPVYQLTLSLAALWATRPRVVCLSA